MQDISEFSLTTQTVFPEHVVAVHGLAFSQPSVSMSEVPSLGTYPGLQMHIGMPSSEMTHFKLSVPLQVVEVHS